MEGSPSGGRPRPKGPPSLAPESFSKRRRTSQDTPESRFAAGPAVHAVSEGGAPPPCADGPSEGGDKESAPRVSFPQVLHDRLSCGAYLLPLLQHTLRQRLRSALRGQLHNISLGSSQATPRKRDGFEPSPAVESFLKGGSSAAATIRAQNDGKNSGSKGASFEAVAGSLAAKLTCCLELKEKSSVLVLGPRGSGATTAVESALRFGDWLKRLRDLLVDSCSLMGKAVVIVLDRVEVCCLSGSEWGRGGTGQQQQLLYNLFDLQHSEGLHICTICLSPVLDLADFMEKRIRSRFTMQKLCLKAAMRVPDLLQFIRRDLLRVTPEQLLEAHSASARSQGSSVQPRGEAPEEDARVVQRFLRAFEAAVEAELSDPQFKARCERALAVGRDARRFLAAAVTPLLLFETPLPRVAAEGPWGAWGAPEVPEALSPLHSPLRHHVEEAPPNASSLPKGPVASDVEEQPKQQENGLNLCAEALDTQRTTSMEHSLLASLSFSEHLVLTAMARLHRKALIPKTFLAVLHEVAAFFKLHDSRRRHISQPALRRAFIRLHECGLLQRCSYGLHHLGLSGVALDLHGSHLPSRFPSHEQ
ncbi:origin recognition complex subunit [Cyclospora cayetanensis]|uniref:Origin recognition complex subunit n=1 Tax=Cyclospora cayetanensis TaxID=88456 RepID=A0A1D3DB77_9EIME|nr:origin recognition complex subunit [Cyclospora cayetanensis]